MRYDSLNLSRSANSAESFLSRFSGETSNLFFSVFPCVFKVKHLRPKLLWSGLTESLVG